MKFKCKYCKREFIPQRPLQLVCSYECAAAKSKIEVKKESDRVWKETKVQLREKLKTVSDYRKDARYWFQRWVRIRDLGKSCISCETVLTAITKFDAGHYYSASGTPQLLFNEFNCSGQCVFCNQHKSGNLIEYRKGLINRYGMETLLDLEKLADDKTKRTISKDEYIGIAKIYKQKCKELEIK